MKKTPIILGATACILAIAGAFTTKASSKVKSITGWTFNGQASTQTDCANSGLNTCKTSAGTLTLYTAPDHANKIKTSH